ncbi:MAG: HAMP domain-containing protein [Candidatus Omnitrophota bacterium]
MVMTFKATRNIGLAVMTTIIVMTGLLFFITTTRIVNGVSGILQKERIKLELIEDIRNHFLDARETFNAFVHMQTKDMDPAVRLINLALKESEELKILVSDEKENMVKFISVARRFRVAIITYAEEVDIDITGSRAIEMEKIAQSAAREADISLTKLVKDIRAKIRIADENILGISKDSQKMSLTGMFVGIVSGLLVAFFMGKALMRPISKLVNATHKIVAGDLNDQIKVESSDEIGKLADSFNKMMVELKTTIERESSVIAKTKIAVEKEKVSEITALNQQLRANEGYLKASNQQLKANEQQLKAKELTLLRAQEELKNKIADLELFEKVTIGRELKMIELKKDINGLLKDLGKEPKYNI